MTVRGGGATGGAAAADGRGVVHTEQLSNLREEAPDIEGSAAPHHQGEATRRLTTPAHPSEALPPRGSGPERQGERERPSEQDKERTEAGRRCLLA